MAVITRANMPTWTLDSVRDGQTVANEDTNVKRLSRFRFSAEIRNKMIESQRVWSSLGGQGGPIWRSEVLSEWQWATSINPGVWSFRDSNSTESGLWGRQVREGWSRWNLVEWNVKRQRGGDISRAQAGAFNLLWMDDEAIRELCARQAMMSSMLLLFFIFLFFSERPLVVI